MTVPAKLGHVVTLLLAHEINYKKIDQKPTKFLRE